MYIKKRILAKSTVPTVRNRNATLFFINRSTFRELNFNLIKIPDFFIFRTFNDNLTSKNSGRFVELHKPILEVK